LHWQKLHDDTKLDATIFAHFKLKSFMKPKHFLLLFCFTLVLLKTNAQRPFITTWDTRNIGISDSTHIIFYATGNNFQIGWVNLTDASDTGNAVGINGADTISFPAPGIYKVYIESGSGSFSAITLSNNDVNIDGDGKKLLSIEQWGDINWSTFNTAFANCNSMVLNALDILNLSNVTDMSAAFYHCYSLKTNAAMSNWDVSNVTDMGAMFWGAWSFNQSIGHWDVSKVTNMKDMLHDAIRFNQPIGTWNVSNVTDMDAMFFNAQSFNQPISNWNVGNVTNMSEMFGGASSFNQPISNWNVGNVTDMSGILSDASSFNQPIGNWNVSNVTNMYGMFESAGSFNQPIGNWNVGNVTDMSGIFSNASSFNQPIGNWNVSNVTNMYGMFESAGSFNQPIGNWNVSKVTDMNTMFLRANNFNQPIGNWNVSKVTNMLGMFDGASSFNQPIGNWDVSKVINMDLMFCDAGSFNQPIGNWNVSNVKNMFGTFESANSFNQSIGNWDVSNVSGMTEMFANANNFNQPIGNWDVRKVISMSEMFSNASRFNQYLGNWKLNSLYVDPNNPSEYSAPNMLDSCGMDCDNYSKTLKGWAANPAIAKNQVLGAANLTYDSALAKAAHDSLTNIKGWTITGDTMGHCSVILPVNFLSFSVNKQGDAALLNWSVANEINNKGYYVEKSINGLSFNSIAFVGGKSAFKQTTYTYTDNNLTNGKIYYRIKEIDNDGKSTYSNIQTISILNSKVFSVSPNPTRDFINIVSHYNVSAAQVNITDMNGKTLFTSKQNFIAGQQMKISLSQFANQVFIITIKSTNNNEQFKTIKE